MRKLETPAGPQTPLVVVKTMHTTNATHATTAISTLYHRPQTKLLGITACFIHIHATSCHFVALAHTICALFYLHPSTPLDGDSPNFSALTSDLLLYTYAHQVDVKSQKLSPYVCKMGRGA